MTASHTKFEELKKRHERECSDARIRIEELGADVEMNEDLCNARQLRIEVLVADLESSKAACCEVQSDFTTLVDESATMVQEIDRYRVLLSEEESRNGIGSSYSPAFTSISEARSKRQRIDQEPNRGGFLAGVRKLTGM
eukprot:CAMPEP_0198206568 /NCGR_PEP_ID=MMETSP1445-20131203/10114_1 /TAXON_ID=36898 /ORGANISM="Pyramimonas sp., Strain CCMP2087" /LENGTH=138 /DNA_ID=CAMNT_0043879319 /DNA_START=3 /DNA_END=419 /DNA_ORIENTATION=-